MNSESLRNDQILCWNCEEAVHTLASQCPYCQAQMKHATKATHAVSSCDKITPLPTAPLGEQSLHIQKEDVKNSSLSSTLLSIVLLFTGCNLLFLGILVGLFSRDGLFTLSWPEAHWPIYFGSGLSFLAFGCIALKALDSKAL